jgi:outer membrane lipoprotein carrier protein
MIRNKFVVFALLIFSSALFADGKTDKLLKEVEKTYAELENVCADFVQTFYWKLTDEKQYVNGTICAKGGDRFKIETDDQLVVTNGKTLWTKRKTSSQVIIDHAENAANENPFIKDFIGKYLKDYNASPDAEKSTKEITCILLSAKSDDQFVRQLRLWIDGKSKLIKKIEQLDLNENTTTFELENINLNASLVNKDFVFKPASDADIVDMR